MRRCTTCCPVRSKLIVKAARAKYPRVTVRAGATSRGYQARARAPCMSGVTSVAGLLWATVPNGIAVIDPVNRAVVAQAEPST